MYAHASSFVEAEAKKQKKLEKDKSKMPLFGDSDRR
jgi:hypothetical protein